MDQECLQRFSQALQRLQDQRIANVASLLTDCNRWLSILREGADGTERGRTVVQFADLLTQYLAGAPGHRVYARHSPDRWLPYYVNHVDYDRERSSRDSYRPAQARINLLYQSLGRLRSQSVTFRQSDIDGRTVAEALAAQGLAAETADLRRDYLEQLRRFRIIFEQVGSQFHARGSGYELRSTGWDHPVPLTRDELPVKVVVDDAATNSASVPGAEVRPHFWSRKRPRPNRPAQSDVLSRNAAIIDGRAAADPDDPEVPVHPYVPVYHLEHHQGYRVHVSDLEEYRFNRRLGDQLVLPEITKRLVDVLVTQGRVAFRDIIEHKGDGACILLGGPPGVGKTLTAEVFAEATERPLLSVQAAQLGTVPDGIEERLRAILQRGSRWNAVVLLDEADVYIEERGGDIHRNAVVAAFLKVLERHAATIFLTTNRLDRVDDAVASRCLARIDYRLPSPEDQKRIWQVLNDKNGTGLAADVIERIVARRDDLSGRDIKQLLKLASLWAAGSGQPITAEIVDFVAAFIPSRSLPAPSPPA